MENRSFSARGCLTFWTPREVSFGALDTALRSVGFREVVPNPRTDDAALRIAMLDAEGTRKDRFIAPRHKPKENGVELVVIDRADGVNKTRNGYTTSYGAVVKEGQVRTDWGLADEQKIQEEYERTKAILPTSAVTSALTDVLERLQGSKPLKPGIYWLPPQSVDQWRQVGEEMEKCGAAAVVLATCEMEPSLANSIVEAFTKEVEAEVDVIVEKSLRGTLSPEQLDAQGRRAEAILEKIESYSQALDQDLTELKRLANVAKSRAVSAAMRAVPQLSTSAWGG